MSKDIDRAFLSSIIYGLGCVGDIDCICAVISVFLLRRGYFCEINVISRANDSGHATIESWNFRDECHEKRAITVWHCKGSYDVCRGISDKKRPNEEETVEFSSYSCDYPGLIDILDSVFPEPADQDENDYFSKLFSGRIGSAGMKQYEAENDERRSVLDYVASGAAKGKKKLATAERCGKYLTNQDDVERIIFCALLDLMEDTHNLLYFANVIFALLLWRGYGDVYLKINPCVRHISLEVPRTIASEGLETCIKISDGTSCVIKVTVNKQKLDGRRIEPNAVYKQSINPKYDPSFKGNTYDGLYDFLSEIFPRLDNFRMPAYLNVASLQSCFSPHHADVELDPIRFYPRSLTKEIYKLEKANNGQVLCRICNKPIETFSDCSADHIVPYSKGGKATLSNMQLAHKSCKSKKKRDKIKNDDDESWTV